MQDFIFSDDVKSALSQGTAIVALESTIISHGMPYPSNLHTAEEVESVVRSFHATPATIAIISGRVHIGLSPSDLQTIAQAGTSCIKCSRRNLPFVLSQKLHGSTTVAATMYLAHLAGLKVFVTGGIGGVHRGAEETWDVSADLIEMGRIPVTVVCAGAKSILDIPKTLEFLETQGVPVIGYGTSTFPAFFSKNSGCEVMCRLDTPKQCADFMREGDRLGLCNGNLIAVPLAEEELAKNAEAAIQIALEEAKTGGITGSRVTPFLLKRVNELSEGESLKANIALIKQNARIGALIAWEYYKSEIVIVIGEVIQETRCLPVAQGITEREITGKIVTRPGGAGYQLLNSCTSEGVKGNFISLVGNDSTGRCLLQEIEKNCGNAQGVFERNRESSQIVTLVSNEGEIQRTVCDRMDIEFSDKEMKFIEQQMLKSKVVISDGNLTGNSMASIGALCQLHGATLLVEASTEWNCAKIIESSILSYASIIILNSNQLAALLTQEAESVNNLLDKVIEIYPKITIVVKDGREGVWKCENGIKERLEIPVEKVDGVSRQIFSGYIAAGLLKGEALTQSIRSGIEGVLIVSRGSN